MSAGLNFPFAVLVTDVFAIKYLRKNSVIQKIARNSSGLLY